MTYAGDRTIYDADSHLMELPDFLSRNADQKTKSLLPDLGALLVGTFDAEAYANLDRHPEEYANKLASMGDALTKGPKWHEALGAFNGDERGRALNLLGFKQQIIFSSFCARLIFAASDDQLAYGAAAAHNRSMAEFCCQDERLMGIAMVPLQDVKRALTEINHAIELGLAGVWIAADAPGGRSPGHSEHNAIWSKLAEAGLPFIQHVGSAPLAIEDEWLNDGQPNSVSARGGAEVIGSKDLTVIHHASHKFLSTLILDGVLEAHPTLKGGIIEIGAGWVPDMLRRLDHATQIWAKSEPQLARMKRLPSAQARDQLRFTPYPFEDVAQLVSESSPELYMFSSDYPHAEGGRDPIGRFTKTTAALSPDEQTRFFSQNFLDLYS
ncbi:MAG: amidohydrolase family protein [Pseudomonadales bacterium]|nr:amidohydrolase family protein [Pseudomonadales bacterium]